MKRFLSILIFFLAMLVAPRITRAAVLYMEPASGTYGPGDSFLVDIKLDTEKNCVNTIEATIKFPRNILQVGDFLSGESFLSVWVDRPDTESMSRINESGALHFSGGIPGGYCGRIPGDPGESNIVGQIIFYVPNFIVGNVKNQKAALDFAEGTRAFINDGFGTEEKLTTKGAEITIADKSAISEDVWDKKIKEDKTPPEPFIIEVYSRGDIFNGKSYITFNTTDKQTGIDHYEVLEIRPNEKLGVKPESSFLDRVLGRDRPAPEWKQGKIPYLLNDQDLLSIIRVKAIDKAGNERLAEYIPPLPEQPETKEPILGRNWLVYLIIFAGLLCITGAIIFIIKTRKIIKSKENNYEEDNKNRPK